MTGDAVQLGTTPEPTGRKLLALVRRRNAVSIRRLFSALVLLALYFLVLNFFVVFKIQPRPLNLDMVSSHYSLGTPGAELRLAWAPLTTTIETGKPLVRPRIMVGERELIPAGAEPDAAKGGVPVRGPVKVEIVSPADVTTGTHRGTLTLYLPGVDPENHPTCPIEVEFTENPWRVWFIARTWFMIALLLFGATYLICVILFPTPTGSLHVSGSLSTLSYAGRDSSERSIRLRMERFALFLPWRRSRLSLTGILDHGGISSANCPTGTLWFPDKDKGPILIMKDQPKPTLYRRQPTEEKPDPARMDTTQPWEDMAGGMEYLYLDPLIQAWISFKWSR
jgi:hypothetical protein